MKVYFIGAGPGDHKLITLKAVEIMKKCSICLYAGSLVNKRVLDYMPPESEIYDSSGLTLEDMKGIYIKAKNSNKNVARLHTGDPSLYGAIGEQMELLMDLGIDYEIIPGVSSFQAAAAVLKKELTIPEISQSVILTRLGGRTPVPERESISLLSKHSATMCIFLSVHMIEKLVEELIKGYSVKTPVVVLYRVTWSDQIIIRGTLENIANKVKKANIKKTGLVIVGEVLEEITGKRSKLYDGNFNHGYRK